MSPSSTAPPKCLVLLGGFLFSCATLSTDHEPVLHTPFAETRWEHRRDEPAPPTVKDVRAQVVAAALDILEKGGARNAYGETDLDDIFRKIEPRPQWTAGDGLDALVSLAKRRGAYHTDGETTPGDIVLFHNQRDVNGNGENDDWLTGAGVVVESRGLRFEAMVRTGNAPRRISALTDRPSLRTDRGTVTNSYVRVPQRSDPPDTAYLAGQLYAGHIDIDALLAR